MAHPSTIILGGGLAGCAAATVLSERGVEVTLVEAEPWLGGRVAGWTEALADGTSYEMERGFHAFFRQYYNVRALLRRIDPELCGLLALEDYPVFTADGQRQSFRNLPRKVPFNIVELVRRTPALRLRDLARTHVRSALAMLSFDPVRTYARFDHTTATEYLDSLRFPRAARQLLFDVFAHSFFNPEGDMSAAELLMMFHFYFTGNPEGLVFDVLRQPFSTGLFRPLQAYLEGKGVRLLLGTRARSVERGADAASWQVQTDRGPLNGQGLVLALDVRGLKALVEASPALAHPGFGPQIDSLSVTWPFAVHRLWLNRPTLPGRAPFVGTAGAGLLDNISLYHLFEDESAAWAERTGGAVVELHAYAVAPQRTEADIRAELIGALHRFYPETEAAAVVHERFLLRSDCPSFSPGSHASRPGVETPFEGLALAGDFVDLPFPSALMEKAVASGFLAANELLRGFSLPAEPVPHIPTRGVLARWGGQPSGKGAA